MTAILPDCGLAKGIVSENNIVVRRARPEHSSRLVSTWTWTDLGLAGDAAELPINPFQVFLGILGLLLYRLMKRAYPQIDQLGGSLPTQER